jgi:hypothetical protein
MQWFADKEKHLKENPPPVSYYFQVRTILDDSGNVIKARYGKMYGDTPYSIMQGPKFFDAKGQKTAKLKISYYLNPDGTRNLEFDPKKNLFRDLEYHQRPTLP